MANAIKMLQDDHNSVRMICKQIPTLQGSAQDEEEKAARQLISMLETHTTLEEEMVYPLLADTHPDVVKQAEEEHAAAAVILAEIKKLPAGMELRGAVTQLLETVEQHVAEEEETIFPLLTEKLGLSGLEDLGRQLMGRQQELMQAAESNVGAGSTAMPQQMTPRI